MLIISALQLLSNPDSTVKQFFTIVIDAGHGGKDSGALGTFSQEKNVVLDIALKLGDLLQKSVPNIKIIYTRSDDTFISLYDRAKMANENKANLFVSLHANSSKNTKARGPETFVMGLHKTQDNLDVAQKENAVIVMEKDYSERYEGYDPKSSESFIIFSLMQNTFLDHSLLVAELIQSEIITHTKLHDRGVKQAGFLVLWNTSMPSVLVEIGFISNTEEEKYINSSEGKENITKSVCEAVKNYINDYNKKAVIDKPEVLSEKQQTIPEKGIFFSIQLTASKLEPDLTKKEYKALQNVFYKNIDGLNKCYSGVYSTYEEVKSNIDTCKKYFNGAFIVAFEDGKLLPVSKAMKKIK